MSRPFNPQAHAERRQAFLDVAASVIERKGFERMTVRDVLEGMQTSKGAFYHYFDSKEALLGGLVEHLAEISLEDAEATARVQNLTASEKLGRLFSKQSQRNLKQKGLMLALGKAFYAEGNSAIRDRVQTRIKDRVVGLLNSVVAQGVDEGIFTTPYPDQVGRALWAVTQEFKGVAWSLALGKTPAAAMVIKRITAAYNDAMARLLGVKSEGFAILDVAQLLSWLEPAGGKTALDPQLQVKEG